MRELKSKSLAQTTQVQPGLKESDSSQLANPATNAPDAGTSVTQSPANLQSESQSENQTESLPKRQRKPSSSKQTATKTKRPATKAKQITATQVKLTWEAPQGSIVARFQQLEHELRQLKNQADQINQQSVEIQTEMEQLRVIAHGVTHPPAPPSPKSGTGPLMPSFMQSSARQALSVGDRVAPLESSSDPQAEDLPLPSLPAEPLRVHRPIARRSMRRRTIRRTLERLQALLQLPKKPIAIVLDALLWTLAAAGLRIGLNFVATSLPLLAMPLNLLIFLPAIAAAYLAIFVPQSSPAILYRLLLVTLGLFVGGKLS